MCIRISSIVPNRYLQATAASSIVMPRAAVAASSRDRLAMSSTGLPLPCRAARRLYRHINPLPAMLKRRYYSEEKDRLTRIINLTCMIISCRGCQPPHRCLCCLLSLSLLFCWLCSLTSLYCLCCLCCLWMSLCSARVLVYGANFLETPGEDIDVDAKGAPFSIQ
jgi:hypothetical protein